MGDLKKTIFYHKHILLGATMVDFGGFEMPVQYPKGIIEEHLATRKHAGLFDVSNMGRFIIRGNNTLSFLQHVLTNNAAGLEVGQAQYTIIQNETGGAIDDAYLYRFSHNEYLLVVNASNQDKNLKYFHSFLNKFEDVEIENKSTSSAMLSIQGPESKLILTSLMEDGKLPEPIKNSLGVIIIKKASILVARTGYTGEPLGFELFIDAKDALMIWDSLIEKGAVPVGLGARDTLRLEAGLPLYGHELGLDMEGKEIPVFACPLAKFAVSFSPLKGNFVGREILLKQFETLNKILDGNFSQTTILPRRILPVCLIGRGVARASFKIFSKKKPALSVGFVTSGTMVPYWKTTGTGLKTKFTDEKGMRGICLALLDSDLKENEHIDIDIRGNKTEAVIVPYFIRSDTPPYARPVIYGNVFEKQKVTEDNYPIKAVHLLNKAAENTIWRQKECINLIPSEQTQSPLVRLLSVMDPAFRYAEHKPVKAFYDAEIFYYQGTAFIEEIERLLVEEMKLYLGGSLVEPRPISGQMANTIVYGALIEHLNRFNRKIEPRRIRCVLNNHIIRGGHLSAQSMGALFNFVAMDPKTEKPAVVNFPVLASNPYKTDVVAAQRVILKYKPELIIFGKSMVLHPEPVSEIKAFLRAQSINTVIMYDMAHVLGLIGPYFQEPFKEGADIVTGSTHKTFFGTQRGIIAANYKKDEESYKLWETISNKTFPGSVSNHHLGTLLGLLMAVYEMNHFKDEYQKKVITNAKAFAKALKDLGMDVAGDPAVSFTETHQVILNVGYAKGIEAAQELEENNIIVNYQAVSTEESFTVSGSLRLGVSEMTRFGMNEEDFKQVAQFIHDVVVKKIKVTDEVKQFRKKFLELKFCFTGKEINEVIHKFTPF